MFKKIIIPLAFYASTITQYCSGQIGNMLLKHYFNSGTGINNPTWDIKQAKNEIMYYATSHGLLSYDGVKWKNIKTPGPAFALAIDPVTENMYIACQNGLGYLYEDKNGNEYYKSILSTEEEHRISKVTILENYIYYYNNHNIYRITRQKNELKNIIAVKKNIGIINHKNYLYVNIENAGLHELIDDKLKPIPSLKWTSKQELLFSIDFNTEYSLVGMHNNCLYLFNGHHFKKYNIESQRYLDENILVGAKDISKTLIAVSTLTGGCLLINKHSGVTEHILNYHTGLPDNEVFTMETDKENGLWLAHGQGLSRASLDHSIKNFSTYPGLEGYLISVISYNHTLYAATSEGVYYLDAAKNSEEYKETILQSTEIKRNFKNPIWHRKKDLSNKKILSRLFSAKEKTYQDKTVSAKNLSKSPQISPHTYTNYIFRKTQNFQGKCKQFLISENHLLALSSIGLYEIDHPNQARLILKNDGINLIYNPLFSNKIYAGLKNGLISVSLNDKEWKVEKNFKIKCPVFSLCEDSLKQLWISSAGKILKLEFNKEGRQIQYKEYFIEEKVSANATIEQIHGKVSFFLPSSVHYYNKESDRIEHDPLFNNNPSEDFILSQQNLIWYRKKESWFAMNSFTANHDSIAPLLSLFKDIKHIYQDNNKYLWIIDGKNELYRINKGGKLKTEFKFNLHIREITNDYGKLLTLNELELDHTNKSINFYLAAPHFLDESSTKYQYLLNGIMEDWSSWTHSPVLKFPFLPSGEYLLQVRAKNVLGSMSSIKTIEFKINPPFWKKTWFYFSEILFFSLLIIISIMLNQNKKNFFLTKILAFVTLIIVIEFIHMLVSSVINVGVMDNPLMRLGADVMLALFISPIEKILEILLFKRKRQIAKLAIQYRKKIEASVALSKTFF